jgi:hypothetical protein
MCHRRDHSLVLLVAIAVHQHDRERAIAPVEHLLESVPRFLDVERNQHVAVRAVLTKH